MKRVNLWDPTKLGTDEGGHIEPSLVRDAVISIAQFATGGDVGRWVGDPIFERVTEGRQAIQDAAQRKNPKIVPYSACGDLVHYILRCIGCRDESLVNRNDDGGTHPWDVGKNLTKLNTSPYWHRHVKGVLPTRGCLCMIGEPAHVFIFEGFSADGLTVVTYDYGKWDNKKGAGGHRTVSKVGYTSGGLLTIGGRTLYGWIQPEEVPLTESAIVPNSFEGGVPDENPYEESKIFIDEGLFLR